MASASLRRTDRVSLTLLLEASGQDSTGQEFVERVPHAADQSQRRGDRPRARIDARPAHSSRSAGAQRIASRRPASASSASSAAKKTATSTASKFSTTTMDLWGIEFPAIAESAEAVARMLLECSYCRNREVVLPERTRACARSKPIAESRAIARRAACPASGRRRRTKTRRQAAARPQPPRRPIRRGSISGRRRTARARQRMRLKTRLTACIRQAGADDELAVCEDISPVGMCFRSKRRYEADTAD